MDGGAGGEKVKNIAVQFLFLKT